MKLATWTAARLESRLEPGYEVNRVRCAGARTMHSLWEQIEIHAVSGIASVIK